MESHLNRFQQICRWQRVGRLTLLENLSGHERQLLTMKSLGKFKSFKWCNLLGSLQPIQRNGTRTTWASRIALATDALKMVLNVKAKGDGVHISH